jgi:hypothetical protein
MVTQSYLNQETLRILMNVLPQGRLRGRYIAFSACSEGGKSALLQKLILVQAELAVIEARLTLGDQADDKALQELGELQAEVVYLKSMIRTGLS